MKRLIPASRAVLLAAGLVMAAVGAVQAQDEGAAKPYKPTIYGGASLGYANTDGSEFGWSVQALARFFEWGGVQVEYLSLGSQTGNPTGEYDGVYVGGMGTLPVGNGLIPYAQFGGFFGDAGDDIGVGGGLMYHIPIEPLDKNNVALVLRTDYKYLNVADGAHLLTVGFMLGFAK